MDEYRDPQNEGSTGSHSVSYSKDESSPADVEIREVEIVPVCSTEEKHSTADVGEREAEAVPGCSKEDRETSMEKELKSKMKYLFAPRPALKALYYKYLSPSAAVGKNEAESDGTREERELKCKIDYLSVFKPLHTHMGRKHKNKFNIFKNNANNLTPEQVIEERSERLQALSRSDGAAYDEEFLKLFVNNTVNSYPNGSFNLFVRHFSIPKNNTALDRLIKIGAYDDVQAGSVDVTGRDDIGMTLLHRAIRNGRHHLVERLISFGFDVNAKTDYMLTPLMMAAIGGHYQIVELLIDARADIYYSVITGMNALHYAALYNHAVVVHQLIEAGIDCNVEDYKQETPLHKAVMRRDNLSVVVYLVDSGANLLAVNFCNYTPLDLAVRVNETMNYVVTMTNMQKKYDLLD